jgi:hypothetical protein
VVCGAPAPCAAMIWSARASAGEGGDTGPVAEHRQQHIVVVGCYRRVELVIRRSVC